MPNNSTSTLEVFNIGKKYKNRPVLRNVSLNVRRGEAVGLLGRHRLPPARGLHLPLFKC